MNRTTVSMGGNQAAHDEAAKSVSRYVENHLRKVLPKDTKNLTGEQFRKIGREAGYRHEEIQANKKEAYTLLNQYATIDLDVIASVRMQKEVAKYKAALLKGYAFIMKTREVITNEKVSYLIMTDSFSDDPTLAKISFEQLIPHVSISINRDREFKLQLFNTDALRADLAKTAKEAKSEAKQAYDNIKGYYKDFRHQGGMQGFQLERAVRSAAQGSEQDYQADRDAFYTGGDLREGENPEGLVEENENIEAKNLASRWGAQLASEHGIETALLTIKSICLNLQEQDIKGALEELVFSKNISKKVEKAVKQSITDKVNTELEKIFQEAVKK